MCIVCENKLPVGDELRMVTGEPICRHHVDGDEYRVCPKCGYVYRFLSSKSSGDNCGQADCLD